MKSLIELRDKNELLCFFFFFKSDFNLCSNSPLALNTIFWKLLTVNQMLHYIPAFLFAPVSVLKLFMSPQERACHFGNCCGEIIVVVKVTNLEDCTMKIFIDSDLQSANHRCNQISLSLT